MKKGFVYLIGAGPGDPQLITLKAIYALERADCIIYDFLANPLLLGEYDCEKIYVGKKGSSHTLPQEEINVLLVKKAREGKTVARLKGGDPFIFGRGGEEAEVLADADIPFCIIPGISSFYSAPAYAGIPLTHRDYANALEVITGHRRADSGEDDDVNFPEYDPDRTFAFLMGIRNLSYIAASLINKKNFPKNIPAAIISWGTMPEQRVISGPLSEIAELAEGEGLEPPAIIVVGGVVALRKKLRWFDTLPLFGKKIVVTRTRTQASKLSRRLLELGAGVIEFPTIEIKPVDDPAPLIDALNRIREFGWVIFTSQNAVNVFFDILFNMGLDTRLLGDIKVAVIGPATGEELLKYGIKPDLIPGEYVAESLLEELKGLKETGRLDIKDRKILLPCSEKARPLLSDGLGKLGADVERINIYRAVKPDNQSPEEISGLQNADIITFTSSSTAKNFFSILSSVKAVLACIGPVTAQTVRESGYEPQIIAEEYTIDGLVEAIAEYFQKG